MISLICRAPWLRCTAVDCTAWNAQKANKNKQIKVVPGDRVTVGVSPYDPVRGIITFRAR